MNFYSIMNELVNTQFLLPSSSDSYKRTIKYNLYHLSIQTPIQLLEYEMESSRNKSIECFCNYLNGSIFKMLYQCRKCFLKSIYIIPALRVVSEIQ